MGNLRRATSRITKKWAIIGGALAAGVVPTAVVISSGGSPASALLPVNAPVSGNHTLIAFPSRDFVSAPGYTPGDTAIVRVFHDPELYPDNSAAPIESEIATADDTGTIEINHPGGFCWATTTPDIRPGDIVQLEVLTGAEAGSINETRVANVRARRPIQTAVDTVVIHGSASDVPTVGGNPIPITEIEQRLVAPGNAFEANGKRTMRAPGLPPGTPVAAGDGAIAYDPVDPDTNPLGLNWTATYSGLSPADVKLALGADSRILWLGNPAVVIAPAVESTIFENSPLAVPGPSAPCTAPLEVLPPPAGVDSTPPSTPSNVTAVQNAANHNSVDLSWDASTDNVGVTNYGVFRNGQLVFTVQNPDLSAPAPTTFTDTSVPPGDYTWTIEALDDIGNASGQSAPSNGGVALTITDATIVAPPINEPPSLPVNIIVFPSRDFISPSGYEPTDVVTVQILRMKNGIETLISQAEGIIPTEDGFAEVNHPGGACWANITPELRAGDIVRTIAYAPTDAPGNPLAIRTIDQTHVAAVVAQRENIVVTPPDGGTNNGVVEVHGTATGTDGKPLPIDQIEQRMIAVHGVGLWELNNRRALRAGPGGDGTIAYDTANNPTGTKWTARYEGLSLNDVNRFAAADVRIHWLGTQPLLLAEATIYENAENSIPGPAGPGCSSPLETPDTQAPTAPTNVHFVPTAGGGVTVTFNNDSTDDWGVAGYRIYDNGNAVGQVGPAETSFTIGHVTPGNHTVAVAAYDNASPMVGAGDAVAQIKAAFGTDYGKESPKTGENKDVIDVTPPTVPQNLVATIKHVANVSGNGGGEVTLTWDGSIDDAGVDHYLVHRNKSVPGSPRDYDTPDNTTTFDDLNPPKNVGDTPGLDAGDYVYTVEAVDAAGNKSGESTPVQILVTTEEDKTPPTVPTVTHAVTVNGAGAIDVHGRNVSLTWVAATDDSTHVAGYTVYRKNVAVQGSGAAPAVIDVVGTTWTELATVNGATVTYLDSNLPSGTYAYAVVAFDSSGNRSAKSVDSEPAVVANDPGVTPHSLIGFPQRDFISATAYDANRMYHFNLIRGATTYTSGSQASDGVGTIEVNHPGGTCWLTNTPDMVPGDLIQIVDEATGIVEQTTIANVTADRPIRTGPNTVQIHGTATAADGSPIPLDQIEQRLITSTKDPFDLNGRRVLRAASAAADGTLAYDAPGSTKWTATYTGLTLNDVFRIVGGSNGTQPFTGAESRGMWLGRNPLALSEGTIFENGVGVAGGPPGAPSCTTPLAPTSPQVSFSTQALSAAVPGVQFKPAPLETRFMGNVAINSVGGSALNVRKVYLAGSDTADFAIVAPVGVGVTACPPAPFTLAAGTSCSVGVSVTPTALGLRQAFLAYSDNAANTTDQTVSLTAIAVDNTHPTITVTGSGAFGSVNGGFPQSRTFVITNGSPDPDALPLTFGAAPSIGGTNASDFAITGNTCVGASLKVSPPLAESCSITVTFTPGARTARTGTLIINHTAAPNATTTTVALTGAGGNGSVITLTNPVTFGSVKLGTSKDQTVSVKNSGNQAATGLNWTVTGGSATGGTFSKAPTGSTCGATLAVNASCNIVVRYTAPASGSGNAPNGSLTVNTTNGIPLASATTLTASFK